jgi:hypothetical protein
VLLNNDTGVIHPGWLRELGSQTIRPDVGAVGAKLLYLNETLQHGGIMLGPRGAAMHIHRFAARNDPGYFGQLALVRTLSAETGACLSIRREVYFELGGMNEVNLPVSLTTSIFACRFRLTDTVWCGLPLPNYFTWNPFHVARTRTIQTNISAPWPNCDICATPGQSKLAPEINFIIRTYSSAGTAWKFPQHHDAKGHGQSFTSRIQTKSNSADPLAQIRCVATGLSREIKSQMSRRSCFGSSATISSKLISRLKRKRLFFSTRLVLSGRLLRAFIGQSSSLRRSVGALEWWNGGVVVTERKTKNRGYQQVRVWQDAITLYAGTCRLSKPQAFEMKRVAGQAIAFADCVHRNRLKGTANE